MPKQYTLQNKSFTLALPTPKRIAAFLDLYGKKKLSELFKDDADSAKELQTIELDLRGEVGASVKLLGICLNEPVADIEVGDLDVRSVARIHMDFFSQLAEKLEEPQV